MKNLIILLLFSTVSLAGCGGDSSSAPATSSTTPPAAQSENCGNINHGDSISRVMYQSSLVSSGAFCMEETQYSTCINGVMSDFDGSFSYSTCDVDNAGVGNKLLQKNDLTYLGAFRVPSSDMGGPQYHGLSYGGSAIAYNPDNNSLYIVGHAHDQLVAEISIPEHINSSNLDDLNTAQILQNLDDITEGNILNLKSNGDEITANGTRIGGIIIYGNKLIGSVYAYYDGGHEAVRSHFKSGLTTADSGDFEGMFEVGEKPAVVPQAGMIAGYMTRIPTNWQVPFDGTVISGMSALSILGRTSSGSAAFSFNPDDLGSASPAPASALLYYPIEHQTIGTYYSSKTLYNKGSHHSGVIFPTGTRTLLYTGRQGLGDACYGPGTEIEAEAGNRYDSAPPNNTCRGQVMTNTADPCCYDPTNFNKGAHAYPYADYAWAYDAEDLLRVKTGGVIADDPSPNLVDSVSATSTETYKPWHIKPYSHWQVDLGLITESSGHNGASAYDESGKRLYVVQRSADGNRPIIHVFSIQID